MLSLLWLGCAAEPEVPGYQVTIEADPTITLTAAKFVDRCVCREWHFGVAARHYQPTKGPSRVWADAEVPVQGEVEVTPQRVVMKSPPRQASQPFGLTHRGHDWSCTPEVVVEMHTAAFPTWKVHATGAVPVGATTLRAKDMHWWDTPYVAIPPLAATPVEIQRFATGVLTEEGGQLWFTQRGGPRRRVLDATPGLAALVGPVEGHVLPARDGLVVSWLRTADGSRSVEMVYGPLPPQVTVENPEAAPADPSAPVLLARLREGGRETTWLAAHPPEASR